MLSDLDDLVRSAMKEWKIPGLALAVIQGGETVVLKGFGERDVDTGAPVTADTQFMLCSVTKSFTAAGLGLLVDERKLDWTQPVRTFVPEFRLHDPVATERVTVRDLLCHHSGLPRHDWIHMPGDLTRAQMLAAMRHLEPSHDLRDTWQYQNLGYVVAGMVAERISGLDWETFTTERLLRPLGCTDFGFSNEALAAEPNRAHPHAMDSDERQRAQLWPIRTVPAGGLNASVSDLAKWMRFLLSGGMAGEQRLLSQAVLEQMMTPRVHVARSELAEVGDIHYGLGLSIEHYRGERTVSHSGSWLGWGTLMTLLPERGIGVAVLTNRAPSAVTTLLACSVFDRLCGFAPIDWLGRFTAKRKLLLEQQAKDKQAHKDIRRRGTQPSHALPDYQGDYEHPAYGRMTVTLDQEALAWHWRGMSGALEHRHYDVFALPEKPAEFFPDGLLLTFLYDRTGTIDRVVAPLEPMVADIVFRRVASGDSLEPAFRQRCVGAFVIGGQRIEITLDAASQLVMVITGQPSRRLIPGSARVFDIDGLDGYRVEFRCASAETVDAIVFHQPDGTFVAPRIGLVSADKEMPPP